MMSSIFYGEIKGDRLNTWKENKNPYDILAANNRIERLGGWNFLFIADELFTDCVQIDWGSFAYKCTKEQLVELTRKTKCVISGIELLKPEKTIVIGIFFQSIDQPIQSTVLSLLRQIIVLVPTVLILGAVGDVTTVLWAGPISDGAAWIVSVIALALSWKKIFRKEEHVK